MSTGNPPLLQVDGLAVRYRSRRAWLPFAAPTVRAVQDVSFGLRPGQVMGLAGESGSGKSTLARAILALLRLDRGRVLLDGADMAAMDRADLLEARRRIQIVFQDPAAALSPRRRIGQTLLEPLDHFRIGTEEDRSRRVRETLRDVGLDDSALTRYPHQFSTGQRQRIALARALMPAPDLLIADEAVSALDVSVQAQILELLRRLRDQRKVAILFISHDLAVIRQLADTVGVMFQGRLVEHAPVDELFERPAHPYTRQLLAAVPRLDPGQPAVAPVTRVRLAQAELRPGCVFSFRCPEVMRVCRERPPGPQPLSGRPAHRVECHLAATTDDPNCDTDKHDPEHGPNPA